jgi:integrase
MPHRKNWKLSPEERLDAREALDILFCSGLTLSAAASLAVGKKNAPIKCVPLHECVTDFLKEKKTCRRGKTISFYEQHLFPLCDALSDDIVPNITKSDLNKHLRTLSPYMAAARFRCVRALWRWALDQSEPYAREDVTLGLKFGQPNNKNEIAFLTVEQAEAILRGAAPHRHALALMMFAGVRPEEIRGDDKPPLKWENIDKKARIVRIPGGVSKTRQARVLEGLPDNLWSWLADGPDAGPITSVRIRSLIMSAQRAGGFVGRGRAKERLVAWPQDGMRHSFATYHVALFADPGKTALLLGHEGSPTMLYRHYRGLTTKDQAEEYFKIVP